MSRISSAGVAALLIRLTLAGCGLVSPTAAAQNSHAAQLVPAKADSPTQQTLTPRAIVPPGNELYKAQRGDSIASVARKYLKKTKYLTSSELGEAIRAANGSRQGTFLKPGEQILIPGILESPIVEKSVPVARDFEVRAIYLTGVMAGSEHGERIIRHWREVGGNSVVFDIKDSDGIVNIAFDHPLASGQKHYISDLPKFVRFLHSQNMHAIARVAIFRDEHLVTTHPELAVKSHRTGQPWRENGKLVWTDPSNSTVQDYDIALAKFVAQSGADEIQFDYVRFPAEGDQKDAQFAFQTGQPNSAQPEASADNSADQSCSATAVPQAAPPGQKNVAHGTSRGSAVHNNDQAPKGRKNGCLVAKSPTRGIQRSDVIADFLKRAYAEIHPTGVLLSLDVFGVMAWQRPVDLSHTGQDIVAMAKHCDVLSPMIYPSHFFGMDGYAKPGDAPEHFIGESMDRFKLITKDSDVVIRPWLQAFAWRTKTYSPKYVEVQVEVAKQKGGIGFLFWNANNDYSKPYAAMPEMRAAKGEYFRGDEVGMKIEAGIAKSAAPVIGQPAIVPVAAPVPAGLNGGGAQPEHSSTDGSHKTPTIWRH